MPDLTLTVIIPVYNDAAVLEKCLRAVMTADGSPQVIVVDDASTDASAAIAEHFPCTVLRLKKNSGAASARNHGAESARGDILFFLDSDILVESDTFVRILQIFQAHPEIAALFGSYQSDTVPQNFVSQYKNLLHHYTHQIARADAATFCGGYGAVRRAVFQELSGFDTSYRALEDIEFGYRLHNNGYGTRLQKDLQFTHMKHYTLARLARSDVMNRAIPWTQLMLKYGILRNDLNTRSNNVLSVAVAFALLLLLPMCFVLPTLFWVWSALYILFVTLNASFLAFVWHERGGWFALRTLAMSWFFYIYSGIGMGLGIAIYLRARVFDR